MLNNYNKTYENIFFLIQNIETVIRLDTIECGKLTLKNMICPFNKTVKKY